MVFIIFELSTSPEIVQAGHPSRVPFQRYCGIVIRPAFSPRYFSGLHCFARFAFVAPRWGSLSRLMPCEIGKNNPHNLHRAPREPTSAPTLHEGQQITLSSGA